MYNARVTFFDCLEKLLEILTVKNEEFDKIEELEENHWWYRGMRENCFAVLNNFLSEERGLCILDIGCGTGGNMKHLSHFGTVRGIDASDYAVSISKRRGFRCEVGDMLDLTLPPNSLDLVTLFDVLYQAPLEKVPDILRRINSGLKTGGLLAMREPAMKIVAGRHDREVGGQQRFEKTQMRDLLQQAGFRILYLKYMNSLLFLPILLKRRLDNLFWPSSQSDIAETPEPLNFILLSILHFEGWLLKFIDSPFGVSVFTIARKE